MPSQNMISASLTQEQRDAILQKVSEIRNQLGFLVHLSPDEVQRLFKASNGFAPLLDKAYHVAQTHAEILPGAFDQAEFRRDMELMAALRPIQKEVAQLADALNDTMVALSSDTMAASLEVYGAMKLYRDKIPGLDVLLDDMATFFRKPRRTPATPAAN